VFGANFLGVIGQSLRLRQQFQTFYHLRIGFRANLQAFILPEGIDEDLRLDARLQPVRVVNKISLGISNVRFVERFAELLQSGFIDFETRRRSQGEISFHDGYCIPAHPHVGDVCAVLARSYE
jgi:hypothetical protein